MFHKILLISCLILVAGRLHAQNNHIVGKLVDQNAQAIAYAGVAIIKLPDSVQVKSSLTDSTGTFHFNNISTGNYLIKASSMGFQPYKSDLFEHQGLKHINLGLLTMTSDGGTVLNAIVVTAQRPLIEQRIDRMVINIENSILAEGSTALELLGKAPGVSVDDEGSISLKGRPGTLVLLNGKLTYLSGKELANLLKGTSSTSISKIEVMSNPSSKYDAAGNGGIINIVMKKNTAIGLNGSVTVNGGSGRNARYGGGTSLNYRSNKVNVYGNYNYAYRGETEYLDFIRNFYNDNNTSGRADRTSFQNTKTNEPLYTHNFRAGADYFLNDKNTLGFLINGNTGKYTHDSHTANLLLDNNNNTTISDAISHNYDKQSWENLSYNLNYVHKFAKEGRGITADVDYSTNAFTSRLNLDTKYKGVLNTYDGPASFRRGYVPSVTDVYVAKVDYTETIGVSTKIETGLKTSLVNSDNNLRYDTLKNSQWINDAGSSNHFRYKEQIHAGYLSINKEFGKFSLQAGLRGEFTQSNGHQITSDSLVKRSYFQLFPTFFATKPFGENHKFQLAYSKRIERPSYDDLNPFRVFRDPFLFYQGNPFLKPELTDALQLSHVYKQKYISAISYNYTKDVMNWVPGQIDSINTTFSKPVNLKSFVNYGISFTATTDFAVWWTATHFANVFHNQYKGEHQGGNFDNKMTSFNLNSQNTFKLGRSYSAELSAFYDGKSVYGVSAQKSYYGVSAGFQKTVLNKMGTIKLMVNDIFQTVQLKRSTQYENIDMHTNIGLDSRRAILSFSYLFGNQAIRKRDRETGSEDVQGRVKAN